MARALAFLRREQEADGSWFGRWGTNYIYGTWSVLCALNAAGVPSDDPMVVRAVAWLASVQRDDGGWGEDEESYGDAPHGRYKESTPSQTAWAVLGLMAAGAVDHPAVARGVAFLAQTQRADGEWSSNPIRRWVSRACSICATTGIGCISHCWRWRGIATCGAGISAGSGLGSEGLSCRRW